MGLLTALLPERRAAPRVTSGVHPSESAGWLEDLLGGGGVSSSGRRVNANNAMTIGALFAGVRLLASSIAQLPIQIQKRDEDGRRIDQRSHRLWSLLNHAPNDYMTAIEWRELVIGWALMHGNSVNFMNLTSGGSIDSIIPLEPERVRFWLTPDRKQVVYEYTRPNGSTMFLPREQVFHLRAPLGSPWVGLGLLALARETLGLAMVAEEHASRFYSNAAAPAGVLVTPKALKKDTWERIRTQWNSRHQGAENSFKTAILEDGLEWKPLALNLRDQQFLETRTFQVQEIARWIGIPPHLIGELSRSTNNNIEAQGIEFVSFAIGPWCVRWEQRMWLDCMSGTERSNLIVKHNQDAFLRGQTMDRYRAHQIGRMGGWLSVNDIRRREDQDPIGPEGDVYMAPLNMVPANMFGEPGEGDGNAPPTLPGGTRTTPQTPEERIVAVVRPLSAAFTPLITDALGRCDRRSEREQQAIERRGGSATAADIEQHRQFCVAQLQPLVQGFAQGMSASLQLRDAAPDIVATTISGMLAGELANAFSRNESRSASWTAALESIGASLAAWATTHLISTEQTDAS